MKCVSFGRGANKPETSKHGLLAARLRFDDLLRKRGALENRRKGERGMKASVEGDTHCRDGTRVVAGRPPAPPPAG